MRKTIHETIVPFMLYSAVLIGFAYSVLMLS